MKHDLDNPFATLFRISLLSELYTDHPERAKLKLSLCMVTMLVAQIKEADHNIFCLWPPTWQQWSQMKTKNAPPNIFHPSSKINPANICVSFVCSFADYHLH